MRKATQNYGAVYIRPGGGFEYDLIKATSLHHATLQAEYIASLHGWKLDHVKVRE